MNVPATQTATSPSPAAAPTGGAPAIAVSTLVPQVVTNEPVAVIAPPVVPQTNHSVFVQERNAELMVLAMNNDSNSLNTIWGELANPDKEIRAGALAAVVQFGNRSVAPSLRELAAQTADSTEKADIIQAADYLELPSLNDLPRAQPRVQKPKQPK